MSLLEALISVPFSRFQPDFAGRRPLRWVGGCVLSMTLIALGVTAPESEAVSRQATADALSQETIPRKVLALEATPSPMASGAPSRKVASEALAEVSPSPAASLVPSAAPSNVSRAVTSSQITEVEWESASSLPTENLESDGQGAEPVRDTRAPNTSDGTGNSSGAESNAGQVSSNTGGGATSSGTAGTTSSEWPGTSDSSAGGNGPAGSSGGISTTSGAGTGASTSTTTGGTTRPATGNPSETTTDQGSESGIDQAEGSSPDNPNLETDGTEPRAGEPGTTADSDGDSEEPNSRQSTSEDLEEEAGGVTGVSVGNSSTAPLPSVEATSEATRLDVKDFGAVGDGVADDTQAIQSALNEGKDVYFPAGIYLTRGNFLTQDGQSVSGEGISSVIKLADKTYTSALVARGLEGVEVKSLRFEGNAKGNLLEHGTFNVNGIRLSSMENAVIRFIDCRKSTIVDCVVNNAHSSPIVLESCIESSITRCVSNNHLREGIGVFGGANCTIENSLSQYDGNGEANGIPWSLFFTVGKEGEDSQHMHKVIGNEAINSQAAFMTINTKNTVVSGNIVKRNLPPNVTSGPGIRLGHSYSSGSKHGEALNCRVFGNKIYNIDTSKPLAGNSRGISCDNASGTIVENNYIEGCKDGIGVSVVIGQSVIVRANEVKNVVGRAIALYSVDASLVERNTIEGCSEGIFIQGKDTSIVSNFIKEYRLTGLSAVFGGAFRLDGLTIKGNRTSDPIGQGQTKYIIQNSSAHSISENE